MQGPGLHKAVTLPLLVAQRLRGISVLDVFELVTAHGFSRHAEGPVTSIARLPETRDDLPKRTVVRLVAHSTGPVSPIGIFGLLQQRDLMLVE